MECVFFLKIFVFNQKKNGSSYCCCCVCVKCSFWFWFHFFGNFKIFFFAPFFSSKDNVNAIDNDDNVDDVDDDVIMMNVWGPIECHDRNVSNVEENENLKVSMTHFFVVVVVLGFFFIDRAWWPKMTHTHTQMAIAISFNQLWMLMRIFFSFQKSSSSSSSLLIERTAL